MFKLVNWNKILSNIFSNLPLLSHLHHNHRLVSFYRWVGIDDLYHTERFPLSKRWSLWSWRRSVKRWLRLFTLPAATPWCHQPDEHQTKDVPQHGSRPGPDSSGGGKGRKRNRGGSEEPPPPDFFLAQPPPQSVVLLIIILFHAASKPQPRQSGRAKRRKDESIYRSLALLQPPWQPRSTCKTY